DSTLLQTARADSRVKHVTTAGVTARLMEVTSQPAFRALVRYSQRTNTHRRIPDEEAGYGNYLIDDVYDGTGVKVYIVDSGVHLDHVEFTGRIESGFDATGTREAPNDNGDVDWELPIDHGTRCASIAAGNLCGVAKGATIVPVFFYGGNLTDEVMFL